MLRNFARHWMQPQLDKSSAWHFRFPVLATSAAASPQEEGLESMGASRSQTSTLRRSDPFSRAKGGEALQELTGRGPEAVLEFCAVASPQVRLVAQLCMQNLCILDPCKGPGLSIFGGILADLCVCLFCLVSLHLFQSLHWCRRRSFHSSGLPQAGIPVACTASGNPGPCCDGSWDCLTSSHTLDSSPSKPYRRAASRTSRSLCLF